MNSSSSFTPFEAKMKAANLSQAAIDAFRMNFDKLIKGDDGLLPETKIDPVAKIPVYETDVEGHAKGLSPEQKRNLLSQTVILKLNGGLGTSMGLEKAKSLLEVKSGETFLTLIAKQIKHLREEFKCNVKFLLMNSFATSKDTLDSLAASGHADLVKDEEIELMQNQSPKVAVEGLLPAEYPKDPELEWCPPGHGDLYAALLGSGILERLLSGGVRYMFCSNSDNLGATLDLDLLSFFASSGKAFLMEVAERTEADKKGGHLAYMKGTSVLTLRESAMCPKEDASHFQDISKYRFFNTNNIWLDLRAVKEVMGKNGGCMPLPLIKNKKTVDPRDASTAAVFQLETAMGAAIESFGEKSSAVMVPRSRFAPVKTTSDLFALRSDAYVLTADFRIDAAKKDRALPIVALDDKYYKLVDQMDALVRVPPSLVDCLKLKVTGPVAFINPGVVIVGNVELKAEANAAVETGVYKDVVKEL